MTRKRHVPGWRDRGNILSEVPFDCLQRGDVLSDVFLLHGNLFLVGSELFYASPYKGKVDCYRPKLLSQFGLGFSGDRRCR